jgi:polar amino acid transport system substrate-binding protein
MKRIVLSILAISVASCTYAAGTGYQVVTEEWAPYNYMEEGVLKGISTEIVEKIMEITNDRFPMVLLPSMRSSLVLNTRPKTIMYSLFRTKERESKYKWVGPILEESVYPYALKNSSINASTLLELKALDRISTRFAGVIPKRLQELGFTNVDASAHGSEALLKMLLVKRSELIVGDTDLGVIYYSRRLNFSYKDLKKIPVEIFNSKLYIAFSLDSDDEVVNSWSKALMSIKSSGALKRIVENYQ